MEILMNGEDFAYTMMFIVFVILCIFPPVALVSAGLTLENIFSFILGSEHTEFIAYHIRRCTLTIIVHSCVPLIYYCTMCFVSESIKFLVFDHIFWRILFQVGLLLPGLACCVTLYWNQNDWNNHPIANNIYIRSGADSRENWRGVAQSINDEMKDMDKFMKGVVPSKRLIITNNWIIKTGFYFVNVAHQSDVTLTVESCNVHQVNANQSSDEDFVGSISNSGHRFNEVLYLDISVNGIRNNVLYFRFSVNSNEYESIKGKVTARLSRASGVVIEETLGTKFVIAFKAVVSQNYLPSTMRVQRDNSPEMCIGCLQVEADVKLVRLCAGASGSGETATNEACGNCLCRPLWCVECMGRWFASRQLVAQKDPSVWMSQKATCQNCRAVFCVLDVVVVPRSL